MGRSKKSSCLKLIACARGDELVDDDDPNPTASLESKVSSEKRRWSFRKKSAGHQLPSSTVSSEPVRDNYNKENIQISASDFDHPKSSPVQEESIIKERPNEIPQISLVLVESELNAQLVPGRNSNASDHAIKESEVVKIQAFIRGYLVRRKLPKLQIVIKLQAAVRGHLVRRQAVGTLRCAQAIIKMQALIRARRARLVSKKLDEQEDGKYLMDMPTLEKIKSCMEPDKRYDSTKSLLSNGFARQLLESTPKTKLIYISCDPSKSDSAWKWLERWMAANPSEGSQQEKKFQGLQGQEENSKPSNIESGNDNTYAELFISSDSKFAPCESTLPSSCDFEKDGEDQSQLDNDTTDLKQGKDSEVKTRIENSVSQLSQIPIQTDETSELVVDLTSDKPERGSNLEKHYAIIDSSLPDAFIDSSLDDSHFHLDPSSGTKKLNVLTENSVSRDPKVVTASECGTEISISSTLDSLDRSEAEGGEIILELGSLDNRKYDANGGSDVSSVPKNDETQPEELEDYDKQVVKSTTAFDADMQPQEENLINSTTRELHGTPASQNSVNTRKNKRESRKADGKLISQTSKRSPGNSTEQLQKDSKNAKGRNSLGLDKPDRVDLEPRISSSDSLPSYMQATESAKAKAHSPKSSPDLHSKENNLKKRYSLPIANGNQGSSPRLQRSPSQAHQNSNGNGNHSPHNSAERRWQR